MRSMLLALLLAAPLVAAEPAPAGAVTAAEGRTAAQRQLDAQYERAWIEAEGWKAFNADLAGGAWQRIDPTFKGKIARERAKAELDRYKVTAQAAERRLAELTAKGGALQPAASLSALPGLRRQLDDQTDTAKRMEERCLAAWSEHANRTTERSAAAALRATVVWLDALAERHKRAAKIRRFEQIAGR